MEYQEWGRGRARNVVTKGLSTKHQNSGGQVVCLSSYTLLTFLILCYCYIDYLLAKLTVEQGHSICSTKTFYLTITIYSTLIHGVTHGPWSYEG